MKKRHKRLVFIGIVLGALAISSSLVLRAFRDNLVFFLTPSQVATKQAAAGRVIRLGGLVQDGSLERATDGLTFRFRVTDTVKTIPVIYRGMLPDLFKEGRGCVVQGRLLADGVFDADQVLAKHDENYMPPETAQAFEQAKRAGGK